MRIYAASFHFPDISSCFLPSLKNSIFEEELRKETDGYGFGYKF